MAARRFEELDILRALPILGLPLAHILEECSEYGMLQPQVEHGMAFSYALFAWGAPIFMFLMGANWSFSRRTTPAYLVHRGLLLLLTGVLLNLVRFVLPSSVGPFIGNGEAFYSSLSMVLCSDIYDFSGAAFLLMALCLRLKLRPVPLLTLALALLTLGNSIALPDGTDKYLLCFLGRFVWLNSFSYFPLTTWFIFPAAGYVFGRVYRDFATEGARARFCLQLIPAGAVGLAACITALQAHGHSALTIYASPVNNYITDLPNVAMILCTTLFSIGLFYYLYLLIQPTRLKTAMVAVSKVIMPFYIIQWVIIGWCSTLVYLLVPHHKQLMGFGSYITATVLTTLLSAAGAFAYDAWLRRRTACSNILPHK